ncbi:MAG: iron-containing alcohol dehydrogenase [Clostridiales bacterium]|nr:iron-containing alcohol dehydrogenase [Clostridiales bacterium]
MAWSFSLPVTIQFQNGGGREAYRLLQEQGCRRGALICGPRARKDGLAEELLESAQGFFAGVFSEIQANPTLGNVDACGAFLKETQADCAVAVGGGSVLDCAKAACVLAAAEETSIRPYFEGGKPVNFQPLPLCAVPTTAGTGSEVTNISVLTDTAKQKKGPMASPNMYPRFAVVDPQLTLSVPPQVTAATGLDVLAHAVEAYWNINHLPPSDALAVQAARLVFRALPAAYESPGDLRAREQLCEASLLAGMAFSQSKTTAPHACSFPLTNTYGLPHGEACAFTLAAFTRLNASAGDGRTDRLARECGFRDAMHMADEMERMKRAMGMRMTLADAGIEEKDLPWLARASMHPNMKNNPVPMDEAGVERLYRSLG